MVKKKWLNEFLSDKYVKDANREGFRSRAAFKLLELDEEFGLFNNCSSVLDLGCAPGSWLQVAKRKTKAKRTYIVGVDILPVEPIQGVTQIEGDFQDESARKKILTVFNSKKIDLILSDMAPNLSGIKVVDGENISNLVNLVFDFSLEHLHKNGCVVVKAFETGAGSLEFRKKLVKYFEKVFERFDVLYNPMHSTFQKTNLDKFKMTPIERILWETFEIPRLTKQPGGEQMVPRLSYFGTGAQYQFSNPKRIISFYLYMILKGLDSNAAYLTEKGKKIAGTDTKEKMEIFGGYYEQRRKKMFIESPHDAIMNSIYGEEDDD